MSFPQQHIETLKHVGDAASVGAVIAWLSGWMHDATTIVGFVATCASAVWFVFRAIDMYWTFRDHLAQRRIARKDKQ